MKVGVILNPIAGGGRLKKNWAQAAASLNRHFGGFELRETLGGGDAERLGVVHRGQSIRRARWSGHGVT